ncbi:MAG: hypothetical protein Q9220_004871 [cf. Caloplaca sp. 1 TL-2023]
MASQSGWLRLNEPLELELGSLTPPRDNDKQPLAARSRESFGDHDELIPEHVEVQLKSSTTPLGVPSQKQRVHKLHVLTAVVALISMASAILAVASETVSWYLGQNNHQLIVLGFLLGIMNLCLGSFTPTFFLLIEAKYGSSTLQNYNGLLRNQIFSDRLNFIWRIVIALLTALPLGLSVAYKVFTGGYSGMEVNSATYTHNDTKYGMFAPPGLQLLGEKTGVSVFSNATLPFAVDSSLEDSPPDPQFSLEIDTFGYNVLILNNESAAILDIPQPSYLSAIQALLKGGEYWIIEATVFGTVASFNHSKTEDPDRFESDFRDFCEMAKESSGAFTHQTLMNDWSIVLLNHPSPGDQSMQYIGLTPDPGINHDPQCSDFFPYASLYNIKRQKCYGAWYIDRGSIVLYGGSCDGSILPSNKQEVIVHNSLSLGVWYMPSLVELIGPFATSRNNSAWTRPSVAVGLAAMVWSRITVLNSPISQNEIHFKAPEELARLSPEDAGLLYHVKDVAISYRPTLRKSGLLYFILVLQPLLLVIMLGLSATLFYTTPVDRGFGLTSIMSGIDRDSLDSLAGAGLSGKLRKDVKVWIRPTRDEQRSAIQYHLASSMTGSEPNRTLAPDVTYH